MSVSKDYFLSQVALPDEIRIGCVALGGLDGVPASTLYVTIEVQEISTTFWGDTPAPWNGTSLVHIGQYPLPQAAVEFEERVGKYRETRVKRKVRLPEGMQFEPEILAIPDLPAGWEHEALQQSSRDIVHVYRSATCGVLVRMFAKAGSLLDHPLLSRIAANLRIVEGQWGTEHPEARLLDREWVTYEEPLEEDVETEIAEAIARARALVRVTERAASREVIEKLYSKIDEIRAGRRLPAEERTQLAIDLGCLWGETLCREKGWEWCEVHPDAESNVYAVCHPTRSHAVSPMGFIQRLLSSKREDNTSALLFNMIVAGDLPEAPPSAYSWLD
ncbi:MAG: hypothetical protein ACK47B_26065 [Armatimonadota bacterium]